MSNKRKSGGSGGIRQVPASGVKRPVREGNEVYPDEHAWMRKQKKDFKNVLTRDWGVLYQEWHGILHKAASYWAREYEQKVRAYQDGERLKGREPQFIKLMPYVEEKTDQFSVRPYWIRFEYKNGQQVGPIWEHPKADTTIYAKRGLAEWKQLKGHCCEINRQWVIETEERFGRIRQCWAELAKIQQERIEALSIRAERCMDLVSPVLGNF